MVEQSPQILASEEKAHIIIIPPPPTFGARAVPDPHPGITFTVDRVLRSSCS